MTETSIALKPEETVRQAVIRELHRLGWRHDQLLWKPEWPIPNAPHDLTKRERGQKYNTCGSADLVAFADDSQKPHALQIIFEFKAPDIGPGKDQLTRYLANFLRCSPRGLSNRDASGSGWRA